MKKLLKLVAGLVVILLLALVIFVATFDPNDYKPQIERLAQEKGGLQLDIQGEIGWSLFPGLALELPAIEAADAKGTPLASLDGARVSVALLPLLSGELKASGLLIEGLELDITKPAAKAGAATKASSVQDAGSGAPGLLFDIGSVEVRNAAIRYRDPRSGQLVEITDFDFRADNLISGQAFPARMNLALEFYQEGSEQEGGGPMLSLNGDFQGQLYLDLAAQLYRAEQARLNLELAGDPFGGRTVPLELQGTLGVDRGADRAWVEGLSLALANLHLTTDLGIEGLAGPQSFKGTLAVAPFDLQALLESLGQAPLVTRDAAALKALGLSARIQGPAGVLGFKDLVLTLDDSRFAGELRYDLASGAQWLRLRGDEFNLDRYLPPAAEAPPPPASRPGPQGDSPYSKAPLMPVTTLQALNVDAEFSLGQLQANNIKVSNLELVAKAKDGTIALPRIAAELYQGRFDNSAVIDASRQPVRINIEKNVQGVQLGGLLRDLGVTDLFNGRFDMDGRYQAQGNSVHAMVNSLDGGMKFDLRDGRLKGINLTDQLCRGVLRVQGKTPDPDAASESYTEFSNVSGSLDLDQGVASNRDLRASLVGVSLKGQGQVDLPDQALDYGLDLTILQELKGPNCQIDNKLHNLALPVRCQGAFSDPPASLCRPDTARMKEVLTSLYGDKVKTRVKEAKEKAKQKVEEKLQDRVQDKLKGLFD